jgi:hypothetical protein
MPKQPKQRMPFVSLATRIDLRTDAILQRLQFVMERSLPDTLRIVLTNYETNLQRKLTAEEKGEYLDGTLGRQAFNMVVERWRAHGEAPSPAGLFTGNDLANK